MKRLLLLILITTILTQTATTVYAKKVCDPIAVKYDLNGDGYIDPQEFFICITHIFYPPKSEADYVYNNYVVPHKPVCWEEGNNEENKNEPPKIDYVNIKDGDQLIEGTFTLKIKVSDDQSLKQLTVTLDYVEIINQKISGTEYQLSKEIQLSAGQHLMVITVYDDKKASSMKKIKFTVLAPPKIEKVYPSNEDTVPTTITPYAIIRDSLGVKKVTITIDDKTYEAKIIENYDKKSNPTHAKWGLSNIKLGIGEHTMIVTAYNVKDASTKITVKFKVWDPHPTIKITSPTHLPQIGYVVHLKSPNQKVSIIAEITDNGYVKSVTMKIDGKQVPVRNIKNNKWQADVKLSLGEHDLYIEAYDDLNQKSTLTAILKCVNYPPKIESVTIRTVKNNIIPTHNTIPLTEDDNKIKITVTCSDDDKITALSLYLNGQNKQSFKKISENKWCLETPLEEGEYTFTIKAVDSFGQAGNWSCKYKVILIKAEIIGSTKQPLFAKESSILLKVHSYPYVVPIVSVNGHKIPLLTHNNKLYLFTVPFQDLPNKAGATKVYTIDIRVPVPDSQQEIHITKKITAKRIAGIVPNTDLQLNVKIQKGIGKTKRLELIYAGHSYKPTTWSPHLNQSEKAVLEVPFKIKVTKSDIATIVVCSEEGFCDLKKLKINVNSPPIVNISAKDKVIIHSGDSVTVPVKIIYTDDKIVKSIEVYLNGKKVYTISPNSKAGAWYYSPKLNVGHNIICVIAKDNDGLTTVATKDIVVKKEIIFKILEPNDGSSFQYKDLIHCIVYLSETNRLSRVAITISWPDKYGIPDAWNGNLRWNKTTHRYYKQIIYNMENIGNNEFEGSFTAELPRNVKELTYTLYALAIYDDGSMITSKPIQITVKGGNFLTVKIKKPYNGEIIKITKPTVEAELTKTNPNYKWLLATIYIDDTPVRTVSPNNPYSNTWIVKTQIALPPDPTYAGKHTIKVVATAERADPASDSVSIYYAPKQSSDVWVKILKPTDGTTIKIKSFKDPINWIVRLHKSNSKVSWTELSLYLDGRMILTGVPAQSPAMCYQNDLTVQSDPNTPFKPIKPSDIIPIEGTHILTAKAKTSDGRDAMDSISFTIKLETTKLDGFIKIIPIDRCVAKDKPYNIHIYAHSTGWIIYFLLKVDGATYIEEPLYQGHPTHTLDLYYSIPPSKFKSGATHTIEATIVYTDNTRHTTREANDRITVYSCSAHSPKVTIISPKNEESLTLNIYPTGTSKGIPVSFKIIDEDGDLSEWSYRLTLKYGNKIVYDDGGVPIKLPTPRRSFSYSQDLATDILTLDSYYNNKVLRYTIEVCGVDVTGNKGCAKVSGPLLVKFINHKPTIYINYWLEGNTLKIKFQFKDSDNNLDYVYFYIYDQDHAWYINEGTWKGLHHFGSDEDYDEPGAYHKIVVQGDNLIEHGLGRGFTWTERLKGYFDKDYYLLDVYAHAKDALNEHAFKELVITVGTRTPQPHPTPTPPPTPTPKYGISVKITNKNDFTSCHLPGEGSITVKYDITSYNSKIDVVKVYLDGTLEYYESNIPSQHYTGSTKIDISSLKPGTYTIKVYAKNIDGYSDYDTVTLKICEGISVRITNKDYLTSQCFGNRGWIEVKYKITSDTTISSAKIYIDGSSHSLSDPIGYKSYTGSYSLSLSDFKPDTTHTIKITATNDNGQSAQDSVTIKICPISSPTPTPTPTPTQTPPPIRVLNLKAVPEDALEVFAGEYKGTVYVFGYYSPDAEGTLLHLVRIDKYVANLFNFKNWPNPGHYDYTTFSDGSCYLGTTYIIHEPYCKGIYKKQPGGKYKVYCE